MTKIDDGVLRLAASNLDGIEDLRIALENRFRALTRDEADSDGETRGLGLPLDDARVVRAKATLDGLKAIEHENTLELQREMRKHPVAAWVKREKGIGEKQAARLIASIGDPYWHSLENRPRTVSELWAYCGYSVTAGAAQRRTKGVKSNWSSEAKMRAFLIAESCVKVRTGNYRKVYEAARTQYEDSTHGTDCVRCGPAGKPALAGTPLSAGHQHARALRLVAKAVLKDIWLESKAFHEKSTPSS